MDSLVGVVDAKLFEGIFFEDFKTINIEHFDGFEEFLWFLAFVNFQIDLSHNPQK